MNPKNFTLLAVCALVVTACAEPASDRMKRSLREDINCSLAKVDIQTLEGEKASVGKRLVSGVRTLAPVSAVVAILKGTWRDRAKVTTGEYNKAIERKISEIKNACGIK